MDLCLESTTTLLLISNNEVWKLGKIYNLKLIINYSYYCSFICFFGFFSAIEHCVFLFPAGRPRTSAFFCVKVRLMRVISHQEDKQIWKNWGWVAEKKDNLKRWKVLEVSKFIYRLEKSLFQTAKGKSVRHHEEKQRA